MTAGEEMSMRKNTADGSTRRGMVLPFTPLSLAFDHVNYYVDMPAVSLLSNIIQMQDASLCTHAFFLMTVYING